MSLISDFEKLVEGSPIPDRFKLWSALTMIGGALERRVWVDVGMGPIYPNLFVLLVAAPGAGKSLPINKVAQVWRLARDSRGNGLFVAPDNFTKPAFLDKLAVSTREFTNPLTGELEIYHALVVASPEFGNFMPAHDTDFLNVLNSIYDAGLSYEEERRSSASVKIVRPIVTILGGTQPDFLANLLPDEAWGMGFTSRLTLIYEGERKKAALRKEGLGGKQPVEDLAKRLSRLLDLAGQMQWTDDAWASFTHWYYDLDEEPKPMHPRLRHYCTRRMVTLCKLCTISSLASENELIIRKENFEEALSWLEEAESAMPDIFKDMAGQSEYEVIAEVHHWLWIHYTKAGSKPIPKQVLYQMLQKRLSASKVQFVVDLMKASGIIEINPVGVVPKEWKEIET